MNSKCKRRIGIGILMALMLISLCACSNSKETEQVESYTSDSLGLYIAKSVTGNVYVVDSYGNQMKNYTIDEQGNIINSDQILIEQKEVKEYKYVTAIISLNDTTSDEVTLSKRIKDGTIDEYENSPTLYEYKVYVSPQDANHCELKVKSSNPAIAELLQSNSGKINADGTAMYEPVEGVATIYIQCKGTGNAQISIESADNSNTSMSFSLTIKETERIAQTESNDEGSIDTTENTIGYVQGTNVRFREKADINAEIISFYNTGKQLTILGLDTTTGWTKCMVDGKTGYIKSEFITRTVPTANSSNQEGIYIVNTPKPTTTPVPTATAAIASNDGNDHGLATGQQTENAINEQDKKENDSSHIHYYVKAEVVAPSSNARGYTLYKCECGASYKTNYKTK